MLQTASAVPPVGQEERVLRLWLQICDQLLGQFPVHFDALAIIVQNLQRQRPHTSQTGNLANLLNLSMPRQSRVLIG